MPNTMSAKKALRQSERKRAHNLLWKNRVKGVVREMKVLLKDKKADPAILREKEILLQKYADKASKEKAISSNKANRLKSRYAQRITAHQKESGKATKPSSKASASKEEK